MRKFRQSLSSIWNESTRLCLSMLVDLLEQAKEGTEILADSTEYHAELANKIDYYVLDIENWQSELSPEYLTNKKKNKKLRELREDIEGFINFWRLDIEESDRRYIQNTRKTGELYANMSVISTRG